MKKILFTICVVALLAQAAIASNIPAHLRDISLPAPAVANCPPPPPACEPPPPVCPPPPPVCKPTPVCEPVAVKEPVVVKEPEVCEVKKVVYEDREVPCKRVVWEEETYTEEETRYETVDETRTRTAYRKVPVDIVKVKTSAKYRVTEPCQGNAPRLQRAIVKKEVPAVKYVQEAYEECYTVQVKKPYTVPVTKTRKVKREIDDVKIVKVAVTVTETVTK